MAGTLSLPQVADDDNEMIAEVIERWEQRHGSVKAHPQMEDVIRKEVLEWLRIGVRDLDALYVIIEPIRP